MEDSRDPLVIACNATATLVGISCCRNAANASSRADKWQPDSINTPEAPGAFVHQGSCLSGNLVGTFEDVSRLRCASFRRLIAIVVTLVLGLWNAETMLADVCDGAATGSCQIVSHSSPSADPPAPPAGSVQVCHCQHAHGGLPVVFGSRMPAADLHADVVLMTSRGIPPATAAPLFRPPIA